MVAHSLIPRTNYQNILRSKIRSGIMNTSSLAESLTPPPSNKDGGQQQNQVNKQQITFRSNQTPMGLGLTSCTMNLESSDKTTGYFGLAHDVLAPLSREQAPLVEEKGVWSVINSISCLYAENSIRNCLE